MSESNENENETGTQTEDGPILGIDLGGTKILAGVLDEDHQTLGLAKRPTPAREGAEAIIAAMVEAADQAIAESGLTRQDLRAIGIGAPGPLDPEEGLILESANLNVVRFRIVEDLASALGLTIPMRLVNDVRAGGVAEYRLGAGRGVDSQIAAFVGTGLGGCVIHDGRLIAGVTGNAGELGHMVVKLKGPRCPCGRVGCLEAMTSRTAIARRIRKAVRKGQSTTASLSEKLARGARLKSGDLARAYHLGDPLVVHEIDRAASILGTALGGLVNLLGPERIVLGGGLTEALGEVYVQRVREAVRKQAMTDPENRVEVVAAELGDLAGLIGAVLACRGIGVGDPTQRLDA